MDKETYIIVGLGNPGTQYMHTRHNMGFDALEVLARRWGVSMNKKSCKGLLCETSFNGKRIVLCEPQTYMNASGECVSALISWYKVPHDHVLVLCDDIDLSPGRMRMRANGSAGTHNGLRSIIAQLGAQDFPRLRLGVGDRPEGWDLANWVLGKPITREEAAAIEGAHAKAADVVERWLTDGFPKAQEMANRKD